jgi:hypothetical protein
MTSRHPCANLLNSSSVRSAERLEKVLAKHCLEQVDDCLRERRCLCERLSVDLLGAELKVDEDPEWC